MEHEYLSGDIELGSVGLELPRDRNTEWNVFRGLRYPDPTSRPADVKNMAERVDGEMGEDHLRTNLWC